MVGEDARAAIVAVVDINFEIRWMRIKGEVRLSSGGKSRFLARAALGSVGFRHYRPLNAPADYGRSTTSIVVGGFTRLAFDTNLITPIGKTTLASDGLVSVVMHNKLLVIILAQSNHVQ